jgi:hypothetical protein
VDIKPGSTLNPIDLSNKGLVPVAIVTTESFDATSVDPNTVCFGDDDNPSQRDCTEGHGGSYRGRERGWKIRPPAPLRGQRDGG